MNIKEIKKLIIQLELEKNPNNKEYIDLLNKKINNIYIKHDKKTKKSLNKLEYYYK